MCVCLVLACVLMCNFLKVQVPASAGAVGYKRWGACVCICV